MQGAAHSGGRRRTGGRRSHRARPGGRRKDSAALLTPGEVDALVGACSTRALTGIRNRALILVLYRAGLRVSEALALHPASLDHSSSALVARAARSHAQRAITLDPAVLGALERWLARRSKAGLGPDQPIFCTLRGQPLKTPYVRALLPRLARKAGISKRVHAGGLRDAHAVRLLALRMPLHAVQARLGHSSGASTNRYLRQLAPAAAIAMIPRPPRDRPQPRRGRRR